MTEPSNFSKIQQTILSQNISDLDKRAKSHIFLLRKMSTDVLSKASNSQKPSRHNTDLNENIKKLNLGKTSKQEIYEAEVNYLKANAALREKVLSLLTIDEITYFGLSQENGGFIERKFTHGDIIDHGRPYVKLYEGKIEPDEIVEIILKDSKSVNIKEQQTIKNNLHKTLKEMVSEDKCNIQRISIPKPKPIIARKQNATSTGTITPQDLKKMRIQRVKGNAMLGDWECKPLANMIKAPIVVVRDYHTRDFKVEQVYYPDNVPEKEIKPPVWVVNSNNVHFDAFVPDDLIQYGNDNIPHERLDKLKGGTCQAASKPF
ncbi:MAG: hypothetical protein GY699_02350 [Desulfobacteraceae bacterium]|nr:hypothetical protein [Desulfobacteraceae bacterium]